MGISIEQSMENFAHQLYDHYCQAVGGLAFNGDPLPKSAEFFADETKQKQANAWRETAKKAYQLQNPLEPVPATATTETPNVWGFSFGQAIEAAKQGHRVARKGWNGSNQFAYIVPANSYPAQTEIAKKQFGDMVPYREYWALKTTQNDVATWAPSGSDSLAEDWIILD